MTRLSVNINKFATLRNSRGGNNPNVVQAAKDCERFGAQGITVHPRPDERHIRYSDVMELKDVVTTEFNIEGYPDDRYMEIIEKVRPTQATLVPDPPGILTSDAGWDTVGQHEFLKGVLDTLKGWGVRTSIFVDTELQNIEGAAALGADRIELYTEPYAAAYGKGPEAAVASFVRAAQRAVDLGLMINAGHDLSLDNLKYLKEQLPALHEVSIGHALVCDAIYYGLENTVQLYLQQLK